MSLTIADVLTRNVLTISPESTLAAAVTLMSEHQISCLVAVESGKPVGIVTEADMVHISRLHVDTKHMPVAGFLSSPIISIESNISIYDAFEKLLKHKMRHLVVVSSSGQMEGILTFSDMLKAAEFEDFLGVKSVRSMMSRHVVSAAPGLALMDVLTRMDELHISCMVAVEGTQACGIFTERDAARLLTSGADLDTLTLGDVMTTPLVTLKDDASLLDAALLMRKKGFRHLVIVDHHLHSGHKAIGVITQFDLISGLKSNTVDYFRAIFDQMEDQMVAEKAELERIVDASPAVLYRAEWDSEGEAYTFAYMSASIAKMMGYERYECLQSGWWFDHLHPEDVRAATANIARLKQEGEIDHVYRFADASGAYHWLRDHILLHPGEYGKPDEIVGSWLDVTKSRIAEQRVVESEEMYRMLVEQSFDGIAILAADGSIIFANQSAASIWGGTVEDLTNRLIFDILHADEIGRIQGYFDQRMRGGGQVKPYEIRMLRKDGKVAWVEVTGRRIIWHDQPADLVTLHNITERKEHEHELLRMQTIVDQAEDCIYATDLEGRYILLNKASERLLKRSRKELIGQSFAPYIAPECLAFVREMMQKKMQGDIESSSYELDIIDAEGDHHCMENNSSLVVDHHGHPIAVQGVLRDISARKQTEQSLRLLESAVGAVNESIIITDPAGVIVYVNPSFERNTGYSAVNAIGKTPAILNSQQHSKAFYEQFWDTISHGKPWAGRMLDRKKDGTIFPVYLSVAPIFDGAGAISHYVAVHEDLSQAEALQKKMAQAQKMEAVGTMVGGVAHDFNNMLASIVGNFYLIRRHFPDDVELQQRIASMEDATQHGANLIRQMLTFARKDMIDMHVLSLSSFIKEAHKMADAAMPENIRLDLNITDADGVCVKADTTQLQQVILNLVTNARHAVEDRFGQSGGQGAIRLKLSCDQPSETLLMDHLPMLNESAWICIRCTDNGCGIKADDLEHVFEPFFTTKEQGRGTGLGLAMVFGAVQNHHGLIDIDSTPGEGTDVSIWLPQEGAEVIEVIGEGVNDVDGKGRVILLVDDEEGLRKVLAEILQQSGFSVLQASDGEQAVIQFSKHRDEIALVLMDVVMPNKGGVIAAQEIRAIDVEVPIIFQTGYGEQTQLDAVNSINHSSSLHKPVNIPDLLNKIMDNIKS